MQIKAWDILVARSSKKKNDTRLQWLDNDLMTIRQEHTGIYEFFTNVKPLSYEISELDQAYRINNDGMIRIIIHGLRLEYRDLLRLYKNDLRHFL